MTQQTHLKLLVVAGYYDLATPFNGIETTVSHMMLEPSVRKNVSFTYYEAGHMMYIDKKAREKLHRDIDSWITVELGDGRRDGRRFVDVGAAEVASR